MKPAYKAALVTVADIKASRAFYEGLLGQEVEADFGENVAFEGGFAIHDRAHFAGLLAQAPEAPAAPRRTVPAAGGDAGTAVRGWGELYFEHDDVEGAEARLRAAGTAFVHGAREQPWAQKVLRCLDPDGHVVEIGESLGATARRLAAGGLDAAGAAARMGVPEAYARELLEGGRR